MKLLSSAFFLLFPSNVSLAFGSSIRGSAGSEKEQGKHELDRNIDVRNESCVINLINRVCMGASNESSQLFILCITTKMQWKGKSGKGGKASDDDNGNIDQNRNGSGKKGGVPDFLSDDELPPWLVDNPSQAMGVDSIRYI